MINDLTQSLASILPELWQWVYLLLVVAAAGFMRGLSGFGFSALCFFALSPILPPMAIVPLMFLLECAASVHIMPKVWSHVPWRWLLALSIGAMLGTPFGVYGVALWQPEIVRGLAGIGVLIASIALLKGWRFASADSTLVLVVVGTISGFVNGMASIGGLVIAVYALSASISLLSMRAALVVFFLIIDIYGLMWFGGHGFLNINTFILASIALPVMLLGNRIGFAYFDRIKETTRRYISIALLMTLALLALADTLVA